ncbi:MAG: FHA domain-containing protein [Anaerolineae bacterium]
MDLTTILFLLRLSSAILLLSILGAFFVVLWRDYASAATHVEVSRRIYGQLIGLIQVSDMFAPTGETFPLRPLTSIGRSPTNTIVIKDDFASSEHALISLKDGRWWLEDRNSRNGTALNSERLLTAAIITDGDIISIGNTHFKLVLDN